MKLIILILILGFAACQSQEQIPQNKENIVALAGEQFIIKEPTTIERVIRKIIFFASDEIKCQSVNHQSQPLVQAKYNLKDYVSNWTSINTWQTQIISAVYQMTQQKVYAMLTSGEILEINYQQAQNTSNLQESQRYKMVDYNGEWMEVSLFADNANLYGLYYGSFRTIQFYQTEEWNWGEELTEGFVSRVINYDVSIYVLTHTKMSVFYEGELMEEYNAFDNETFIDFDIDYHNLYLLTADSLLIIDSTSFEDLGSIDLQYRQNAKKIRVKDNKLMVQFQRHGEVILREYAINDENLQEGVIHRQYEEINEIILLDQFAIIVQNFEFNLVQLQLETQSVILPQDKKISFKYETIVELKSINEVKAGTDIFLMLVLPNSIQFIEIKNTMDDLDIFQRALSCNVEQSGIYEMQIRYDGLCQNQTLNECSELVTYNLEIKTNEKNHVVLWIDLVLILGFTVIIVLGVYCYCSKKNILFEEIKEEQNKLKNKKDMKELPPSTQEAQEPSNMEKTYEQITSYKF